MEKVKKNIKKGKHITFSEWKKHSLHDQKLRTAYEALQPKYAIVHAILDARIKKGMTQADIARHVGTTQSVIARFESGTTNPTLEFLSKISAAVGARLEVRLSK